MSEKPNFYSVIPATVRYDTNLSSSEKLFYSELTAMSNAQGFCWASNSYFSELYNVSKSTISLWIKKLESKNHIKVHYQREGKQIVKREIYPIQKIGGGWSENLKGGSQKIERGWSENLKENNTSINNTSINIDSRKTSFSTKVSEICIQKNFSENLKNEFLDYWTEHGENDKKMRFEKQTSFSIPLRLEKWKKNNVKWKKEKSNKKMSMAQKMRIEYGIN